MDAFQKIFLRLAVCRMQKRMKAGNSGAVLKSDGSLCVLVGEALGAIGDSVVLNLLKEYSQDPVIEVRAYHKTCLQLST